jgi:lipoprotein NlpD
LAAVLLLAACSSTPERPDVYTVKRGDTLYSIAWRHRLEYQDLARWNGIGRDYVIHPGQKLRMYPPARSASRAAASRASGPVAGTPKPQSRQKSPPPPKSTPKPPLPQGPPVQWQWPVNGGTATLTSRPNGGEGLTIAGRLGEEIRSAGAGRVVYTGSGLLGYGQLIIVKHSETYLSAYGHLQSVLTKEGETVSAGQRIATMGAGPQGSPMLYFEIRINGSPRNPLVLLPQR